MFKYCGLVMSRSRGSPQGDRSCGPVNDQIALSQPGISKDVVVLLAEIHYEEVLDGIPFIDP